jgi:hypothetical protein
MAACFNNLGSPFYLSFAIKRHLKKLLATLCFFLILLIPAKAQTASCGLRFTLLTCAPGDELYSTFGHTAIRVQDSATGSDFVFNYGTFEFAPDFYSKFVRGKLLYSLSVEPFPEFIYLYQLESRSVVEQEIMLSCTEKQQLYSALQENAREENRHYRYDFLFDNCTTRARDIVARQAAAPVVFNRIIPEKAPTFRNLIHIYLNRGKQHWSKLGIDLLLGAKLDRRVSNQEAMFLPDNLLKGFDTATTGSRPLVSPVQKVIEMPSPLTGRTFITPFIAFSLLLLVAGAMSVRGNGWPGTALKIFDRSFFFILGLIGVLLLFMWFGTDHQICANNYNLLWALPVHLAGAFLAYTAKGNTYFRVVFWLTVLLLVSWAFLPQELNPAFIPLVVLIGIRSWALSKTTDHATKRSATRR